MITPGQQLAEKLHAYVRQYDDQRSSRVKDLFDMLVIAEQVNLPDVATLAEIAKATFDIRETAWPPDLLDPPADWAGRWVDFVAEYPLRWQEVGEAFQALRRFWDTVFDGTAGSASVTWSPEEWVWS